MGGSVKLLLSFLGMSLKRPLHPCLEFRCIRGMEEKAVGGCPMTKTLFLDSLSPLLH